MEEYKKNSLSLTGAVSLGTGVMIGAGIFALLGQVAELSGELFGARLLAITNNLTGKGSLHDADLGEVEIQSYLKDRIGAGNVGGNYVITLDIPVTEGSTQTQKKSIPFANKDEIKAFLQNLIVQIQVAKSPQ